MASGEPAVNIRVNVQGVEHLQDALKIVRSYGDVMGLQPAQCREAIEQIEAALSCLEVNRSVAEPVEVTPKEDQTAPVGESPVVAGDAVASAPVVDQPLEETYALRDDEPEPKPRAE